MIIPEKHNLVNMGYEEAKRAMRSSRAGGAVGQPDKLVVPRVVRRFARPEHRILDYGAGHKAQSSQSLKNEGFNVTAHDLSAHLKPEVAALGLHDLNATGEGKKYDLIYSSNVLNVQNDHKHLRDSLNEIHRLSDPRGMFIANLPSPLYDAYKGLTHRMAVAKVEKMLQNRFKNVERLKEFGNNPVWVCKNPREFHRNNYPVD